VIIPEDPARAGRELSCRYTAADLQVFTADEARRFAPDVGCDPQADRMLAWELLYRLEPGLYDRLIRAERLHPGIVGWLPRSVQRIVEVGAGSGRLTMELIERGQEVVAIEPAAGLRGILERKLAAADHGCRARVMNGFFDELPVPSGFADLVVACSVLTPEPCHGGDVGLTEMERICGPGGCVAIIWPNNVGWLTARGYHYRSFAGAMAMEFASHREAVELAEIFYPHAAAEVRNRGSRRVPYHVLCVNPPRDLAFKDITR
jgi:SAM-dependent methyltransferase